MKSASTINQSENEGAEASHFAGFEDIENMHDSKVCRIKFTPSPHKAPTQHRDVTPPDHSSLYRYHWFSSPSEHQAKMAPRKFRKSQYSEASPTIVTRTLSTRYADLELTL